MREKPFYRYLPKLLTDPDWQAGGRPVPGGTRRDVA